MKKEQYKIINILNAIQNPPHTNQIINPFCKKVKYDNRKILIISGGCPSHIQIKKKSKFDNFSIMKDLNKDFIGFNSLVGGAISTLGPSLFGLCSGVQCQYSCILNKDQSYSQSSLFASIICGIASDAQVIVASQCLQKDHYLQMAGQKCKQFGNILIMIDNDKKSYNSNANFIGIRQENGHIYVSYRNLQKIINPDSLGKILTIYKNKEYSQTAGIIKVVSYVSALSINLCQKLKRGHHVVILDKAYRSIIQNIS